MHHRDPNRTRPAYHPTASVSPPRSTEASPLLPTAATPCAIWCLRFRAAVSCRHGRLVLRVSVLRIDEQELPSIEDWFKTMHTRPLVRNQEGGAARVTNFNDLSEGGAPADQRDAYRVHAAQLACPEAKII
eukprot:6899687-Prymnesium_polylepis.2